MRGIDPKASEVPVVKPKPKRDLSPFGRSIADSGTFMLEGLRMGSVETADDAAAGYRAVADRYEQMHSTGAEQ